MNEPSDFFQVGTEVAGELRVYLRYALFRALEDFALRDTSREQAGLLMGRLHEGPEGAYVTVEQAVEMGLGEGESRFAARNFERAGRLARERYPDLQEMGWFHTHPGTGLELSQEEQEVHRRSFSRPWQVVYVVDPVLRERGFHTWQDGELRMSAGFRIYGKEERVMADPGRQPNRTDDPLRERYLERSLEKIQRMLRHPAMQPRDYLSLGLLAAILLVLLFRPAAPAPGGVEELAATQQQVADQVARISQHLEKLEGHLAALQVIDRELALTPVSEPPGTPPPAPTPEEEAAPPEGTKVILHTVKKGDTLSTICQQYYDSADPSLVSALGKFNKLKPPDFELWPGDTVKIPSRRALDS